MSEKQLTPHQFYALGYLIEWIDDGNLGYAEHLRRQGYAMSSYHALERKGYVTASRTLSGLRIFTPTRAGRDAFSVVQAEPSAWKDGAR